MRWPWTFDRALAKSHARPNPIPEIIPPPRITATCCGRSDFAVGSPTGSPWFDGTTVGIEHSGPTLCCAHCGTKYGLSPSGLYAPHPDALPPHWAMAEERRRAVDAEIRRRSNGDDPSPLNRATRRMPRPAGRPRDPED